MSKKDNDWLSKLNNCSERLTNIHMNLDRLAAAFYTTGNENMFEELDYISNEISNISKQIDKASGEVVAETYKTSQENSGNVLRAVLAGIGISKENKDNKQD